MISVGAQAAPEAGNRMPFHMEPVRGGLTIRGSEGLRLYRTTTKKVAPQGTSAAAEEEPLPAPMRDGRYAISLEDVAPGHALYLRE